MSCKIRPGNDRIKPITRVGKFMLALIVFSLASGCRSLSRGEREQDAVFRPPTQAVSPTLLPATPIIQATATSDSSAFYPTATPTCSDGLTFIEDLTIPDGAFVAPGEVLDKRWQVQNSGSCNWDESYTIQHTAGLALGAPERLALYPARSGAEAMLKIEFIAPGEAGTYRSAWQAFNPQGEAFGDPFYIEFTVSP